MVKGTIDEELVKLEAQLREEQKPLVKGQAKDCRCGNVSRTGTCAECLKRQIKEIDGSG